MSLTTTRRRRPVKAKVAAERLGISVRTVYRYVAEERQTYEERAAERRRIAGEMSAQGLPWADIAAAVGGSEWAARALVRRYRAELASATAEAPACGREVGEGRGLPPRPQKRGH